MGVYRDRINYVPHDFNTTVLTINSEHKAVGLDSLTVARAEDAVTVKTVGDGTGIPELNPSREGTITFSVLEASATNDYMWDLYEAGTAFPVSVLDSNAPNLDASGTYCYVSKVPDLVKSKEHSVVEWTCICVYLKMRGGSYTLATP